jgi:hypothetical protein
MLNTTIPRGPKMLGKTALVLALAGASTAALAATWVDVVTTNNSVLAVDKDSIVVGSYPLVKYWARQMFNQTYVSSPGATPEKWRVSEFLVNCSTWQVAYGPFNAYTAKGELIFTGPGTPDSFQDITPDTTGDVMSKAVCGKK